MSYRRMCTVIFGLFTDSSRKNRKAIVGRVVGLGQSILQYGQKHRYGRTTFIIQPEFSSKWTKQRWRVRVAATFICAISFVNNNIASVH